MLEIIFFRDIFCQKVIKGDAYSCPQTPQFAQLIGIGEYTHWPPVLTTDRQAVALTGSGSNSAILRIKWFQMGACYYISG